MSRANNITTMTPPKHAARQRNDIRKEMLKKLAGGAIRQSELERLFPNAGTEVVRSVIAEMHEAGKIRVDEVNGRNMVSLPRVAEKPSKKDMQVEPILPKVEQILPRIEPLERAPGVFVPESPERLILSTLAEGARMRDSLIRIVAGQLSSDEANKLLNRMVKSGIVSETRSGRISLVEKHGHT